MKRIFQRYIRDFLQLLFPRNCIGCEQTLLYHENKLCLNCLTNMPYTDFFEQKHNKAYETLRAQHLIENVVAMLYFRKKGIVQHMLHQLKYQNRPDIGVILGEMLAKKMMAQQWHLGITAVAGIPISNEKLKKRGYNQCDSIIEGLRLHLDLKNLSPYLKKIKTTESQTKKHRFERYQNLDHVYAITQSTHFKNEHILLIDDIITTGATFSHLIEILSNEVSNVKISVASIAITS